MKIFRFLPFVTLLLFIGAPSFAQVTEDPTNWQYELKKKSATEYQIIFHLDIKEGWHIWSLHPGGDGYEIAPTFTVDKNPKVKLKGSVTEKGKTTTTTMEGIDGKITYLSGKIDYVQNITVTGKTKINGKHMYQVCNDKMCLRPTDKDFALEIK
jgi:cytochrome c biogenesis DsbD-like protein